MTRDRSSQSIERFVLELPVGAVVVNQRYDIQLINNTARELLSIHSPASGEDLLHLIQGEDAYTKLRSAIDHAFREQTATSVENLTIEEPRPSDSRHLQLLVSPQWSGGTEEISETVTILINDITDLARSRDGLAEQLEFLRTELEQVQGESEANISFEKTLNRQLEQTNRQLIDANKRLLETNEDLQVANEELQITAAEAQAATEEVETLNEELQATNEELETLNEELQSTIEELNTTTDDLQARNLQVEKLAKGVQSEEAQLLSILNNRSVAILVVDTAGASVFRSSAYEQIFGENGVELENEDGSPLSPEQTPRQRGARGESFVMKFSAPMEGDKRRYFEATGQPLQSSNQDEVRGLVVIRELGSSEDPEDRLQAT